jgi:hypothetical protein
MATAIAIALAGFGITAIEAAPLGAVDASSGRHGVGPADLAKPSSSEAIRFVPLRELPTMLDEGAFSSNKGIEEVDAVLHRTAQTHSRVPAPLTATAVVMASWLAQPDVTAQVHHLYEAGIPVAVLRGDDPSDIALAAHAFGAAMRAKVAIYFRGSNGKLDIVGAGGDEEVLTPADMADRVTMAIHLVAQGVDEVARASEMTRNSRTAASMAAASGDAPYVPRIELTGTMPGTNGSSIRTDVTVLRDSTVSRDVKRVISRATYQANPQNNGLSMDNRVLTIPDRYRLMQSIGRSDYAPTDTVDIYPVSDGRTDITFSESRQSTTNYGFNISPNIERELIQQVPNASAKAGFGFDFAKSYTDQKSIQFTVKDYYIATSSEVDDIFSQTTWNFRLADNIRNNVKYFGNRRPVNNITPMMRQAQAATYAAWNLPGSFEGWAEVRAEFTIHNRVFNPYANEGREIGKDNATILMGVFIDTSSPYLTRATTMLIQSSVGAGSCLQTQSDAPGVSLGVCDSSPGRKSQQWTFDERGRYQNRETKQCLQADGASGGLGMNECSLDQRQRFSWVADRIHNLYNNDNTGLRLVAGAGGAVNVSSGKQALPPNINHPLLVPWSSYPGAAEKGDTVPGFRNEKQIDPDWVGRYMAIPNNERWDVIPLRVGL